MVIPQIGLIGRYNDVFRAEVKHGSHAEMIDDSLRARMELIGFD